MTALLDTDPAIIGEQVDGVEVRHVDDLPVIAAGAPLAIGVIATPAAVAQRVADMMVGAGVSSILNFAPRVLEVPPDVLLRYVDLSIELQVMSFYQSRSDGSPRSRTDAGHPVDRAEWQFIGVKAPEPRSLQGPCGKWTPSALLLGSGHVPEPRIRPRPDNEG